MSNHDYGGGYQTHALNCTCQKNKNRDEQMLPSSSRRKRATFHMVMAHGAVLHYSQLACRCSPKVAEGHKPPNSVKPTPPNQAAVRGSSKQGLLQLATHYACWRYSRSRDYAPDAAANTREHEPTLQRTCCLQLTKFGGSEGRCEG